MKSIIMVSLFLILHSCGDSKESESNSRSSVKISQEKYFPDSLAISKDGSMFVGSMWTGQIDKITSGSETAVSFIPAEEDE